MTTATRTCLMCGQAEYETVSSVDGPAAGISVAGLMAIPRAKVWRVQRCPRCGNVQLFLVEGEVEQ